MGPSEMTVAKIRDAFATGQLTDEDCHVWNGSTVSAWTKITEVPTLHKIVRNSKTQKFYVATYSAKDWVQHGELTVAEIRDAFATGSYQTSTGVSFGTEPLKRGSELRRYRYCKQSSE